MLPMRYTRSPHEAFARVAVWPMLGYAAFMLILQAVSDSTVAAVVPLPPAPGLLTELHMFPALLWAGFLGGIINARRAAESGIKMKRWIWTVIVGAILGNYLPVLIAYLFEIPEPEPLLLAGMALTTGWMGERSLTLVERAFSGKIQLLPGTASDGSDPNASPPAA